MEKSVANYFRAETVMELINIIFKEDKSEAILFLVIIYAFTIGKTNNVIAILIQCNDL